MELENTLPHLFRTEYRKIVSVLCRTFGLRDVETAEDIASETFLTAAQSWGIEGMPPNPTAWLYTVARNKAINHLKRSGVFKSQVVTSYLDGMATQSEHPSELPNEVFEDSQLRLMFALCHPAIAVEMQVALCLRLLCGFGVGEIAEAFVTDKENISKRLLRAKGHLRDLNATLDMPPGSQMHARIGAVLTTIYLVFNEGYYSNSNDSVLRKDLCLEAIRLCTMLIECKSTNVPEASALMALMCFHFSRFESRIGTEGELIPYDEQVVSSWNVDWITRGGFFLQRAGRGEDVTAFHLEAAIAYYHAVPAPEKWETILNLYDKLLLIKQSPIVAMNRAYALYKVAGPKDAIAALEHVDLDDNHLYHALLGQLWSAIEQGRARYHFNRAIDLAQSTSVKQALRKKLDDL
ncbi:sigma-70 family RNA polymerase sigma factor [Chryseolinea sp. T2]|uniref:RNA polymerase sigma factor n=1 Tax=Chryseolinea sp. T2 TaxID=3129255 RepID=UPI00307817EB